MFICVTAKYSSRSSSAVDISRKPSNNVVKTETVDECRHYRSHSVTSEQRVSASCSNEDSVDGNPPSSLSPENELMLTDVLEVISCDTAQNADASTSCATFLPSCELKPTSSSALTSSVCLSADLSTTVCRNSESTAGRLLGANSQTSDRPNPVAAAFSACRQYLHQKKPS